MSEYKDTLNLPQTDFPMKANLSQREPEILKKWQDINLYATLRRERKDKKKFILLDGPPYANGHIHVGHAVNKILKDIIVKSKSLSGYDAPYVPGWDCHGLPIELNVEKKHGKPGRKLDAAAFRVACREYAASQIDIQREEFKRLGVLGDWDNPYITMDFKYEANIIRSLSKIIANHHLQKGYKPVHWCLDCASALAEAEVEYADKTSPSIDVRFTVVDNIEFWGRFDHVHKGMGPISIPIWTTTPWTLPANEAVALNPLLQYVLVATPTPEQFLIAEDLLGTVITRYGIENHTILGRITGEKLAGLLLTHPFYAKQVPVVLGDHVTIESGTGAVHTAPAHGVDDYLIGKKYHLPLDNPVGDDGCFTATTALFAGLHVSKANDVILETLRTNGALIHFSSLSHSYPHCWRHKTPLIFRATPQWFVSMDKNGLRAKALQAIARVDWIPDWGQVRIAGLIANRPDWCISRQRVWGVPLALFVNKQTGELHADTLALMEEVALRVEKEGVEAWYALDAKELLGKDADQYQKTMDVLDVWFDSGVVPEVVLKSRSELSFPADIVLEGSDQHRGWFQSQLNTSVAMNGKEPYRQVLTHGFVVDAEGRKMSKSLGNVIAPTETVQTLGADIMRLWVASVDYRNEMNASQALLNRMSESYRRIRNTARFLLSNLNGFDVAKHKLETKDMLMLDRYILEQTRLVQDDILEAYATYQFHTVVQKLHQFCIVDLGGFYLDIIKDRQYTMQTDSRGRRSAQTALFHIAHALVRWMAPIMSFTAEEIWQYIPGEKVESVLLTTWYEDLAALSNDEIMNPSFWETIRAVREAVNKEIERERNAGKIGSALEAEVYLYCGKALQMKLDALQDELRFVLITSFAKVLPEKEAPVDAITTELTELRLKIEPTKQLKCERCWHRRSDVNKNADYPGLCGRCVVNVSLKGEERQYA